LVSVVVVFPAGLGDGAHVILAPLHRLTGGDRPGGVRHHPLPQRVEDVVQPGGLHQQVADRDLTRVVPATVNVEALHQLPVEIIRDPVGEVEHPSLMEDRDHRRRKELADARQMVGLLDVGHLAGPALGDIEIYPHLRRAHEQKRPAHPFVTAHLLSEGGLDRGLTVRHTCIPR
jgi:hypothetical protein